MSNVKPWANGPLELLRHAEGHLSANSDFDRRMALISFDNSIETSITTYLQLHPAQREGRAYEGKAVERWSSNYHTKLEFLEEHVGRLGQPMRVSRDEIIWYHKLRNEIYHAGNGLVPEERSIEGIRRAALWAFSVLFGVEAEGLVTADSASPPEPVREIQQDRFSGSMALVESYIKFEKTLEWSQETAGLDFSGEEPPDLLKRWEQVATVRRDVPDRYGHYVEQAHAARNEIVHGEPTSLSEGELRELASHLDQVVTFLERRLSPSTTGLAPSWERANDRMQAVLKQIERDIGPTAASRLADFLARVQNLNLEVHPGKRLLSFQVWSLRRSQEDGPRRRLRSTVFYVDPLKGRPRLSFPVRFWRDVVGPEADPLIDRIRDMGPIESKWVELRVYLRQRNDEATFDRIFPVVQGIVQLMQNTFKFRE